MKCIHQFKEECPKDTLSSDICNMCIHIYIYQILEEMVKKLDNKNSESKIIEG